MYMMGVHICVFLCMRACVCVCGGTRDACGGERLTLVIFLDGMNDSSSFSMEA